MSYEREIRKYGWVCPNCGLANAPWVSYCCRLALAEETKTLREQAFTENWAVDSEELDLGDPE